MSGRAIKSVELSRVICENLPMIADKVAQFGRMNVNDLYPVGSAAHCQGKETIGDADFMVDAFAYDFEETYNRIKAVIGEDRCYFNKGTRVASFALLQNSYKPDEGFVQVDLMFVSVIKWGRFAYFSPPVGESAYKGAVRTALLMGVAGTNYLTGMDYLIHGDDGELLIRAGRTFDLNVGLRRIFQYRPMNKKGTKYLKHMKTISKEEFFKMYPEIKISDSDYVMTDPTEALSFMFDDDLGPFDVRTAEQIIRLIKLKFPRETQKKIFAKAADRLHSIRNDITLPREIQECYSS